MADALTPSARGALRQALTTHFSMEELALLCDDLHVDAETLPGREQGKEFWAGNIARYFELAGQIEPLLAQLAAARPNADWSFARVGLARIDDPADGRSALEQLTDEFDARKRTIRIFNVSVPAVPLLLGVLAVLAASAVAVWFTRTPARMNGEFNIAVAQFGAQDAQGVVSPSSSGDQLSALLYERLNAGLGDLPDSLRAPLVWHDSMSWLQKRARIGLVANEVEAAKRARELGADILIYGNLQSSQVPAGFTPKFYITQALSATDELDQIKGNHQLGQAIAVNMPLDLRGDARARLGLTSQLDARMRLLARLTIGLLYDLTGDPATAAGVFEGAAALPLAQQDGAEVLHYFTGKQYLYVKPRRLDDAQAAFERALAINPAYARAQVGLGGVCVYRALQIKPPDQRLALLPGCAVAYERALAGARAAHDDAVAAQALTGAGAAHRLLGEAQVYAGNLVAAGPAFADALASLNSAQQLASADDHRLQGMLAENLGDTYQEQADLLLRRGNAAQRAGDAAHAAAYYKESAALFGQSVRRYEACVAQSAADPLDQLLALAVRDALCLPHKALAEKALEDHPGKGQ